MRLAFDMPFRQPDGAAPTIKDVMTRARLLESIGFDGIWFGEALGRQIRLPDPLMWLVAAAAATEHIELGTSVLQVPLRSPAELAQRLNTMQALVGGRFSAGLGAGSTKSDFDAAGVDFRQRFQLFDAALPVIRGLLNGEQVGEANLRTWPSTFGGPPILLGVWLNETWVRKAARYDGWIASSSRSFRVLAEGIKRFRDAGGKRALVNAIDVDLSQPDVKLDIDEAPLTLKCGPTEAAERLHRLQELGFDDALLRAREHTQADVTEADLVAIRGLHPTHLSGVHQ